MWVVSERYEQIRKAILVRCVVLLAAGILVLPFALIFIIVAILIIATSDGMPLMITWSVFLGIGGFLPLAASTTAIVYAVKGFVALSRFRMVTALLRAQPGLPDEQFASAMGITPSRASEIVRAAVRAAVLEASPIPASPLPSQPSALLPTEPIAHLPAEAKRVGLILGTYQVEALMGRGGMGAVYRARHMRTGRRYALKTMLADARFSPSALQRFHREAMAASALGHPNIVAVHDFNQSDDGTWFMVMDLLEGETIAQRLQHSGRLPWGDAREIALQIGEALAAAHDKGLIHRDIKPSNIFLDQSAEGRTRAVLLDFGLVKPLDAATPKLTSTGVAVGTPLYMAPEQARGEPVDGRSDVFALAAVVYEMVTGSPPFVEQTLAEVYGKLLRDAAPRAGTVAPAACPADLDRVLAVALAKSPADRYATMRGFVAALGGIAARTSKGTVVI